MWTDRRRSWFMLVRVKVPGKMSFVFPLFLPVLEETFDVLGDLALVGDALFPGVRQKIGRHGGERRGPKPPLSLTRIVRMLEAMFAELQRYGRWQMVEVEAKDVRVSVEFY